MRRRANALTANNLFQYADGNPIRYVDPDGEFAFIRRIVQGIVNAAVRVIAAVVTAVTTVVVTVSVGLRGTSGLNKSDAVGGFAFILWALEVIPALIMQLIVWLQNLGDDYDSGAGLIRNLVRNTDIFTAACLTRVNRVISAARAVRSGTDADRREFMGALLDGISSLINLDPSRGRNGGMRIYSARLLTSQAVCLALADFIAPHFRRQAVELAIPVAVRITTQQIAEEIYGHAMVYHHSPKILWVIFDIFTSVLESAEYTDMGPRVDSEAQMWAFIWNTFNFLGMP